MSMDQSEYGFIIDFQKLKEQEEQALRELSSKHEQEVLDYKRENQKAACKFWKTLMEAIFNDDFDEINNLFNGLQNIERPSLFLDLVMNMTDEEDNTPLLLAINLEKPKIVRYLKEAAKKHSVFIDNNRVLKYVRSTLFENDEAKKEICEIFSITNLLKKYRDLQLSLQEINWGIPKDDQSNQEMQIEAESFGNPTLEMVL